MALTEADIEMIRDKAREAVTLLKALSNENRLMILCQLVDGEKCVGELEQAVGLSQSALSQHLARLRHDGVVLSRRHAQHIYYSLAGEAPSQLLALLFDLFCAGSVGHCSLEEGSAPPGDRDVEPPSLR